MGEQHKRRHVSKTSSYTIKSWVDRPGQVFDNRGASGSVTFTLPTASPGLEGWWYRFKNVEAQALVVATPAADTLLTKDDAAADSVSVSTIGAEGEVFCDGVQWQYVGIAVGHTYAVTTN